MMLGKQRASVEGGRVDVVVGRLSTRIVHFVKKA